MSGSRVKTSFDHIANVIGEPLEVARNLARQGQLKETHVQALVADFGDVTGFNNAMRYLQCPQRAQQPASALA